MVRDKERPARDGSFPSLLPRSVSDAYLPADGRSHVVAEVLIPAEEPVLIAVAGPVVIEVEELAAIEVEELAVPSSADEAGAWVAVPASVVEAESGGFAAAAPAGVGLV
jgi:hypothetical protein